MDFDLSKAPPRYNIHLSFGAFCPSGVHALGPITDVSVWVSEGARLTTCLLEPSVNGIKKSSVEFSVGDTGANCIHIVCAEAMDAVPSRIVKKERRGLGEGALTEKTEDDHIRVGKEIKLFLRSEQYPPSVRKKSDDWAGKTVITTRSPQGEAKGVLMNVVVVVMDRGNKYSLTKRDKLSTFKLSKEKPKWWGPI